MPTATGTARPAPQPGATPGPARQLHRHRRPGPPGAVRPRAGTSSYLWRHVIDQLDGQRRCVAVDLPLHGQTPAAAGQDFSLPGLARFLADCCDALELTDVDLVANDTGGAVSQVFAAGHPERLHTLTLTNCEAHDNLPPKALAARGPARPDGPVRPHRTPAGTRRPPGPQMRLGSGYQDVASLPDDIARAWLEPLTRHQGIGPPVPAAVDLTTRPRPARGRARAGPPARPDPHRLGHRRQVFPPPSGPTGSATPSPAPPRSSRSRAPACSFPTSGPPNSPRRCAAIGTPTRDIRRRRGDR